jgi:hypothetical protein
MYLPFYADLNTGEGEACVKLEAREVWEIMEEKVCNEEAM